jgi:hypothetical protein
MTVTRRISYCHHVDPTYTAAVRLNWNSLRLATIPVFALLLGAGCSGINASGNISPATFFLPGLVQRQPEAVQPGIPTPPLETNHLLARFP